MWLRFEVVVVVVTRRAFCWLAKDVAFRQVELERVKCVVRGVSANSVRFRGLPAQGSTSSPLALGCNGNGAAGSGSGSGCKHPSNGTFNIIILPPLHHRLHRSSRFPFPFPLVLAVNAPVLALGLFDGSHRARAKAALSLKSPISIDLHVFILSTAP